MAKDTNLGFTMVISERIFLKLYFQVSKNNLTIDPKIMVYDLSKNLLKLNI